MVPGHGRHAVLALAAAILGLMAGPAMAQAASISVNTEADSVANDGSCSLREAITAANANVASGAAAGECAAGTGTDAISVPGGDFGLSRAGANENANATGDLDVTSDLSITGAGVDATSIGGAGIDRVLHVLAANGLGGTGGASFGGFGGFGGPGGSGGAISTSAAITVTGSRIFGNDAGDGARGGGGGTFVASSKKLAVTATASARDALGRSKTTTGKVTLQPAKKKKKKKN